MNKRFSNYFCLMIEGSGPGSIPLTSGSGFGSERPKNMWILWIRIHIRIWEDQKHVDPERYSSQPVAYKPFIVCSMDQISNRLQC